MEEDTVALNITEQQSNTLHRVLDKCLEELDSLTGLERSDIEDIQELLLDVLE